MVCFTISYDFFIDRKKVANSSPSRFYIENIIPEQENIHISWDNVEDYAQSCSFSDFQFTFRNTNKGKKLILYVYDKRKVIKQWKQQLSIEVRISFKKYDPTIKEVLEYRNADYAIQYLNEKGVRMNIGYKI